MKTKALLITGKTVEGGCSERKRPMFIISSKLSGMWWRSDEACRAFCPKQYNKGLVGALLRKKKDQWHANVNINAFLYQTKTQIIFIIILRICQRKE